MRVLINGENRELPDRLTVTDLVHTLSLPVTRIAVELNRSIVRRKDWDETILNEDDRIEIVHFVGGGAVAGN